MTTWPGKQIRQCYDFCTPGLMFLYAVVLPLNTLTFLRVVTTSIDVQRNYHQGQVKNGTFPFRSGKDYLFNTHIQTMNKLCTKGHIKHIKSPGSKLSGQPSY